MVKSVTKEGFVRFLAARWLVGPRGAGAAAHHQDPQGRRGGRRGLEAPHEIREEDRRKVLEIKDLYIDVGASSGWTCASTSTSARAPDRARIALHVMANPDLRSPRRGTTASAAPSRRGRAGVSRACRTRTRSRGGHGAGGGRHARRADHGLQDPARRGDRAGRGHRARHAGCRRREKLGGGPLIVVYDASSIPSRGLLDLVMDTAKKLRIPLQFEAVEARWHRRGPHPPERPGRAHDLDRGPGPLHPQPRQHHQPEGLRDVREAVAALVKRLDRKTVDG